MMAVNEFDTVWTVEQARALRAAARVVYGAQRWIDEAYTATLERLSTVGDIHADKFALTAHEAADAEFDAILAEYRSSDAKAEHDAAGEPSDLDKWLDALAVDEAQGEFTDWRM